LVSFGTGEGKIAFFDLRASKFLSIDAEPGEEMSLRPQSTTSLASLAPPPPLPPAAGASIGGGGSNGAHRSIGRFQGPNGETTVQEYMHWRRNEYGDDVPEGTLPAPKPGHYLQTGPGWIQENRTFFDYFGGRDVYHACYAHAWDPTGARIFACGGPLAFGLTGGYMALWE
jgi:WD repeat-containing protein 40A